MPASPSTLPAASSDMRQLALHWLLQPDPSAKVAGVRAAWARWQAHGLAQEGWLHTHAALTVPPGHALPGRPERPELVDPGTVPQRSPFTPEGHAALAHAIAHIEFNAINLALDAVWRYPGMPADFYRDWWRVAAEEAEHFDALRQHLRALPRAQGTGWDYGDFQAHDGLWTMCERTAGDIIARMALVPRTLEARGLDATPQIQAKLARVGTPAARALQAVLEVILRDEVGHVAIGNRWYRWLCERAGLEPLQHYQLLLRQYAAPRPRPPFNAAARLHAGFSAAELDWLQQVIG